MHKRVILACARALSLCSFAKFCETVSPERVAASVVSGPVRSNLCIHSLLPVYKRGQNPAEINAFLPNTDGEVKNSATHAHPDSPKIHGDLVKNEAVGFREVP